MSKIGDKVQSGIKLSSKKEDSVQPSIKLSESKTGKLSGVKMLNENEDIGQPSIKLSGIKIDDQVQSGIKIKMSVNKSQENSDREYKNDNKMKTKAFTSKNDHKTDKLEIKPSTDNKSELILIKTPSLRGHDSKNEDKRNKGKVLTVKPDSLRQGTRKRRQEETRKLSENITRWLKTDKKEIVDNILTVETGRGSMLSDDESKNCDQKVLMTKIGNSDNILDDNARTRCVTDNGDGGLTGPDLECLGYQKGEEEPGGQDRRPGGRGGEVQGAQHQVLDGGVHHEGESKGDDSPAGQDRGEHDRVHQAGGAEDPVGEERPLDLKITPDLFSTPSLGHIVPPTSKIYQTKF